MRRTCVELVGVDGQRNVPFASHSGRALTVAMEHSTGTTDKALMKLIEIEKVLTDRYREKWLRQSE